MKNKNKTLNQLVYLGLLGSILALPVHAATITVNGSYVEGAVTATSNGQSVFESADDFAIGYFENFYSSSGAQFYGEQFPPIGLNGLGQAVYIPSNGSASGSQNSVYGGPDFYITNTTDRIYGSGASYANVYDPNNDLSYIDMTGRSIVNITFSLASDHAYSLTGSLLTSAFSISEVRFNGDSTTLDGDFSYDGILAAGEYNLFVESSSGLSSAMNTTASYDYDLQLTAVPVPAAIWLFGSGLIGLAGFAKRK